jgi:DNA-binding transcriptional ArsR family regulator
MNVCRDRTDTLVHALDNKLRVEILRYLAKQGPGKKMCARELSEDLGRRLDVVAYHVQVLDECGAIRLAVDPEPAESIQWFYVFNITAPWTLAVLRDEENTGR